MQMGFFFLLCCVHEGVLLEGKAAKWQVKVVTNDSGM
jgi:hypothetical protein